MMQRMVGKRAPVVLSVGVVLVVVLVMSLGAGVGPDADARVLVKLDDEWSQSAAARDVEAIVSYYADDALVYPPNEPLAKGRAAATRVWAAYFADPTFSISWKTTHADVSASGELGYTAGVYEDSYEGPDGAKVHETGKYLCVWKKQKDGTWKAIQDMWNADGT